MNKNVINVLYFAVNMCGYLDHACGWYYAIQQAKKVAANNKNVKKNGLRLPEQGHDDSYLKYIVVK